MALEIKRLGEYTEQALCDGICDEMKKQVDLRLSQATAGIGSFLPGKLTGEDAAKLTAEQMSQLIGKSIIGHQAEDSKFIAENMRDSEGIKQRAYTRAAEIRGKIAANQEWVTNFKLNDPSGIKSASGAEYTNLDILAGVDAEGNLIKANDGNSISDSLAERLRLSYQKEQLNAVNQEAARRKAAAVASPSAGETSRPATPTGAAAAASPPASPPAETGAAAAPPPPSPPAGAAPTPPSPSPAGTEGAAAPGAQPPSPPPAGDDLAALQAELNTQTQQDEQRAEEAAAARQSTPQGQGGGIMASLGEMGEGIMDWFKNIPNQAGKIPGTLLGIGLLGLIVSFLFEPPLLMMAALMIGFTAFVGTGGFGMFGGGGQQVAGNTPDAARDRGVSVPQLQQQQTLGDPSMDRADVGELSPSISPLSVASRVLEQKFGGIG